MKKATANMLNMYYSPHVIIAFVILWCLTVPTLFKFLTTFPFPLLSTAFPFCHSFYRIKHNNNNGGGNQKKKSNAQLLHTYTNGIKT